MAEVKKKASLWIWLGVLVVAVAIFGYLIYKNTASADFFGSNQGSGYHFEVLSDPALSVVATGGSSSTPNSWRITQPVGITGGFGLRVRQNGTNQIVTKNITWQRSSSEGFFPLYKNQSVVGVYPYTSGNHQISAKIGTGRSQKTITLSFSTTGYSASPTPTVPYELTFSCKMGNAACNPATGDSAVVNVGDEITLTAKWQNNPTAPLTTKLSGSGVAEVTTVGSTANSMTIKVKAKAFQPDGSAWQQQRADRITFVDGAGNEYRYFMFIVNQPRPTPAVTQTGACTTNSAGQTICS